jgi:hypothetical protein
MLLGEETKSTGLFHLPEEALLGLYFFSTLFSECFS